MGNKLQDTIVLFTPFGHEVTAELDYEHYELHAAKVIHTHTGVMKTLDKKTQETLTRALKAKKVYEHALEETKAIEHTLQNFSKLSEALGNSSPALQPYFQEAEQHRKIAKDMGRQARHFYNRAMRACDDIAGS